MALITEKRKSDTEENRSKAWLSLQDSQMDNMSPTLPEEIKTETDRYYREGSKGILEACNEVLGEKKGIVHITDMARKGEQVRMLGLAGSPLYIALHLHRYEEAEQILKSAPQTAEPGYVVQQFRVTFAPEKPDECEIELLAGGEVYLEEILLTDMDLPDDMCIRLWNIWFQRNVEDNPHLFVLVESDEANEVPLLRREWPSRVRARRKFGDLRYTRNGWSNIKHSREEYEPYKEAVEADLEQFWKGLKGLYRLKTLDENLYARHVDERLAAHLILQFLIILADLHSLEKLMGDKMGEIKHLNQLKLAVDGAEALRKLKKGLEKLGFTYISGDALWDAWMDYHFDSDRVTSFWIVFQIWEDVFDGKVFITLDELRKERSRQLLSLLLHDTELLHYLDGLRWTMSEEQKWLNKERHDVEKSILGKDDHELLLVALEKNLFLPEDIDFLWENYCKEEHLQLKPLLLMKKYGYV